MDDIVSMLRTPVFWVCTVLVGIAGSIVANYCQRGLDRLFGSWNDSRARRALALNQRFNEDLRLLHNHSHLIQFSIAAENRHRLKAAIEALMGVVICAMALMEPLFRTAPLSNYAILQVVFFIGVVTMTFARAWRNMRECAYHSTLLRVIYEHDREQLLSGLPEATPTEPGPVTLQV